MDQRRDYTSDNYFRVVGQLERDSRSRCWMCKAHTTKETYFLYSYCDWCGGKVCPACQEFHDKAQAALHKGRHPPTAVGLSARDLELARLRYEAAELPGIQLLEPATRVWRAPPVRKVWRQSRLPFALVTLKPS